MRIGSSGPPDEGERVVLNRPVRHCPVGLWNASAAEIASNGQALSLRKRIPDDPEV
jgi:hypothetical protein